MLKIDSLSKTVSDAIKNARFIKRNARHFRHSPMHLYNQTSLLSAHSRDAKTAVRERTIKKNSHKSPTPTYEELC